MDGGLALQAGFTHVPRLPWYAVGLNGVIGAERIKVLATQNNATSEGASSVPAARHTLSCSRPQFSYSMPNVSSTVRPLVT